MSSNTSLLEDAAAKLRHLVAEVVFVGGSTLDLIVTDQASTPIRTTDDVDVIVEVTTYVDFMIFSERLRELGFSEDSRPGAPLCRFLHSDLVLDVMPLDESVLGFSNRWYPQALQTAEPVALPSGRIVRVITAPFFLGTKMEAFHGRGKGDYWESHDLEDFIAVVEGRESLFAEITAAPRELRAYLRESLQELIDDKRFLDALPGFVLGDRISQQRVPIILERLRAIARL